MVGSNEAGVSPPVISLESSSKEYPMAVLQSLRLEIQLLLMPMLRIRYSWIHFDYDHPSVILVDCNRTFDPPVSTPMRPSIAME